jgi:hypothetical protein
MARFSPTWLAHDLLFLRCPVRHNCPVDLVWDTPDRVGVEGSEGEA